MEKRQHPSTARSPKHPTNRRRFLRRAGGAAALLALGGGYTAYSNRIEVTRHRWSVPAPLSRPLRVVAVSDLHLRESKAAHQSLADALRAAEPDVLAVVGDTVDRAGSLELVAFLSRVHAPLGKFATLGNWEHAVLADIDELSRSYERAGVRLLVNDVVEFGEFVLVGLDDWLGGSPRAELAIDAAHRGPALVLSHCPVLFDTIAGALPEETRKNLLVLAGHTHGGQIAPFGLAVVTPPGSGPYISGPYERGEARLYVMRGVGSTWIPLRLGARPEILILELS